MPEEVLQRCNFCQRYFPEKEMGEVEIQDQPEFHLRKVFICGKCEADKERGIRREE